MNKWYTDDIELIKKRWDAGWKFRYISQASGIKYNVQYIKYTENKIFMFLDSDILHANYWEFFKPYWIEWQDPEVSIDEARELIKSKAVYCLDFDGVQQVQFITLDCIIHCNNQTTFIPTDSKYKLYPFNPTDLQVEGKEEKKEENVSEKPEKFKFDAMVDNNVDHINYAFGFIYQQLDDISLKLEQLKNK